MIYAVVAGLVSVGAISAITAFDGEISDLLLAAGDAARAMFNG